MSRAPSRQPIPRSERFAIAWKQSFLRYPALWRARRAEGPEHFELVHHPVVQRYRQQYPAVAQGRGVGGEDQVAVSGGDFDSRRELAFRAGGDAVAQLREQRRLRERVVARPGGVAALELALEPEFPALVEAHPQPAARADDLDLDVV